MNNLTLKQKIILGIIIGVMLIVIGIYGYTTLNHGEELELSQLDLNAEINNQNLNNEGQNMEQNETESNEQNKENLRSKRNQ